MVVRLLIHWLRSVEPSLTTGRRALLRVRFMPQLRRLNKEWFNENIDTDIDRRIRHLVAICLKGPRIQAFHNNNQEIGLEPEYVELVRFMLKWFKRERCTFPVPTLERPLHTIGLAGFLGFAPAWWITCTTSFNIRCKS